jgi:hypothetical protein
LINILSKELIVMKNIKEFIVHEELLVDHRSDGLRSGEGCVAVLPDDSLYCVYGSFTGPADHDQASLIEMRCIR